MSGHTRGPVTPWGVVEYSAREGDEEGAERLAHLKNEKAWAEKQLAQPEWAMANGRGSHDVAGEVLDRAENGLIEFICVRVIR